MVVVFFVYGRSATPGPPRPSPAREPEPRPDTGTLNIEVADPLEHVPGDAPLAPGHAAADGCVGVEEPPQSAGSDLQVAWEASPITALRALLEGLALTVCPCSRIWSISR